MVEDGKVVKGFRLFGSVDHPLARKKISVRMERTGITSISLVSTAVYQHSMIRLNSPGVCPTAPSVSTLEVGLPRGRDARTQFPSPTSATTAPCPKWLPRTARATHHSAAPNQTKYPIH